MSDISGLKHADIEKEIKNTDIVILEPDRDTNDLLKLKLELSGFKNVIPFVSLDDCLKFIEQKPDNCLLLMDVFLNDRDWVRAVRTISLQQNYPVIVISALSSTDEIARILSLGAADVLVKPFDMEIFILKVEKVLTEFFFDQNLSETYERNEKLFLNILQVMARVIEARFPYVQFHSQNVGRFARLLGTMSGLPPDRVRLVGTAGVLHDLGKIGVREEILNKPGKLTDEEYEIIKTHPIIASEVLNPISEMNIVLLDVRHHHEWYKGTQGYPDGLQGEDIPVGARILHVAEAYETMIGERVYKEPFPKERAVQELLDFSGTQFDPDLVSIFVEYLNK